MPSNKWLNVTISDSELTFSIMDDNSYMVEVINHETGEFFSDIVSADSPSMPFTPMGGTYQLTAVSDDGTTYMGYFQID